jgi:tetratricopeptide (TPR) repeat protein
MALPREEGGAYSDKVTAAEYKKIEELHRKVTNELEECRSRVEKFMDPFVAEAQSRESEAQASSDTEKYNEAFKKWNTVAQLEELQQEAWLKQSGVEASDSKGDLGMARIRGILNERAKAIYTEGILAESYSDFAKAREKFEELQKIAPSDDQSVDSYFARARRKLAVYSQFDAALGRARQPAAETPPVAPQPVPTEPPPQSGGTL